MPNIQPNPRDVKARKKVEAMERARKRLMDELRDLGVSDARLTIKLREPSFAPWHVSTVECGWTSSPGEPEED